jgi:DNA-binding FadR family transcriptional regulator
LKLCRARLTAACEKKLLELVRKMEHWKAGSEIDAATLDLEFHRTIWINSGNEYLEKALNSLVPCSSPIRLSNTSRTTACTGR